MDDIIDEAREKWLSDEAVEGLSFILDAHEELREKYEKRKESLTRYSERVVEFMRFKRLFDAGEHDGEATIETNPLGISSGIEFVVYIDRPEQFGEVLELFYEAGLRQRKDSKERVGKSHVDYLVKRKFYFESQDDPDVTLKVNVKVVGDDCKKVKVGEETKSEPVYEVVCE